MKKLITVLFFISSFVFGQTINFDTADNWTAGSGGITSYQTDHQYNDVISGFDVNFSGGPALRQGTSLQDGFAGANGINSWRLRDNSTVEWFVTLTATQVSGFSFLVRRWDANPSPDFDVAFSIDGGTNYTSVGTINNTFLDNSSDWKLFSYGSSITSSTSNIIIRIKANGTTERIMIDDFNFDSPLPVELTTFTASMLDNKVELNWETATEINNYGFEIERASASSATGKSWETLGFVEGHGNSNSPKFYSYTDKKIEASGNYNYRLKQIDIDGTFEYSDVVEANLGAPESFELDQNYPNPFNPLTSIRFNLPTDSNVKLTVFNVLGQEVAELVNKNITAGYHSVNFDGSSLNSGIYFYQLETNNFTQIRKMMLVK